MTIVCEAKLDIPAGAHAPDSFVLGAGLVPPDSFVVSRQRDGSPASTFGDWTWCMSAYHPEGRTSNLHFTKRGKPATAPVRVALLREVRQLMFVLMWLRDGSALGIRSLQAYLGCLLALANYAEGKHSTLAALLSDHEALLTFARSRARQAEQLASLLSMLGQMGVEQSGFTVPGRKTVEALLPLARGHRANNKQHPPMPTRVYSEVLSRLRQELSDWEAVAPAVLDVAYRCATNCRLGRKVDKQRALAKELGVPHEVLPTFKEVAAGDCLAFLEQRGASLDTKGVSRLIHEAQMAAKLTIQAYTGMREDEAASLPYHCTEVTSSGGKQHYLVYGRTTKFNNGLAKRTRWVTNAEGFRAIQLAQAIANTISQVLGVAPEAEASRRTENPLFVSVAHLELTGSRLQTKPGHIVPGDTGLSELPELRARLEPLIEEADLLELEHIDLHRAWRTEAKFQVGNPWRLTSHQFRRSLALYAQRSGLVSLPSLRRQLQHLTDEMSRYYANGSAYAKDFIGDDSTHFGREWQNTQAESSALSYIMNVLLSDEVLIGGHANWVAHRGPEVANMVAADREVTIRRFKKGELAYKETLLGGCTKVGNCDQPALNWLETDCLGKGCRNMVCSLPKLDRAIAAQRKLVDALDPNTVEFRSEQADLAVLVAAQAKAMQQLTGDAK